MRLKRLDSLRGCAIILMVVFHLNYSLVSIFSIEVLNFSENFWFIVGKIAVVSFMIIFGMSFFFAEKKYKEKIIQKYIKVAVVLGVLALAISLSTFYFFPEQHIKFGIIHFFSLSSLLLLCCRYLRYYNILLACGIIIFGFMYIGIVENHYMYFLGFRYPGFTSVDYYPLFPYFGFPLLGYVMALFLNNTNRLDLLQSHNKENIFTHSLEYLGKYSLVIYIIHQPIIIGSIFILQKLILF